MSDEIFEKVHEKAVEKAKAENRCYYRAGTEVIFFDESGEIVGVVGFLYLKERNVDLQCFGEWLIEKKGDEVAIGDGIKGE